MSDLRPDWNPGMISTATPPARPKRRLASIAAHTGGNALAIMAAALIPMSAMAGSAVDMSRLYVVKVRLQQACDAGALAGRKFMVNDKLDSNSTGQAKKFFANNFATGFFNTTNVVFEPKETTDGQVDATASATVPMTVMKMFGKAPVKLNVTCQARLDLADADVMFVLDTTGSMSCTASDPASCTGGNATAYTRSDGTRAFAVPEKSGSKIAALRSAVVDFYDTLKAAADPSTHLRFGFVTYTSTVNVGKQVEQVNSSYLIRDNWTYQSRRLLGDANSGNPVVSSSTGVTKAACDALAGRSPATGYTGTVPSFQATVNTTTWTNVSGGTCQQSKQKVIPNFEYGPQTLSVTDYVGGSSVIDPTKIQSATSKWQGCIEERQTSAATSFSQSSLPYDLDPDLVPSSRATRWAPLWPDVEYLRQPPPNFAYNQVQNTTKDNSYDAGGNYADYYINFGSDNALGDGLSSCGKQAERLQTMSRSQISNYVNASDFKAIGGTYHDIGMIWGTRFISPSGIFANDTAPWPNRNPPNRNIIFMTDGNMAPTTTTYGTYGNEWFDRRVTAGAYTTQTARHNSRFVAACNAAKARNITVWVVVFGAGASMTSDMIACASSGKNFYASNDAELRDQFKKIATQIAELRLSQ